ncbi:2Fe-2S iron-sulfur cluster-binding protein [Sphingobium sp. TCM1]|uniref:2Fe-2S iron-sulfur cluster-binding protein n=1 Tax=Sphingobium sp. TCM1 TaxID=453246 RepID=UPI0007F41DB0|nr:2Fe-2S iron-sulfur cluster-binding protein [Sphingobium sp. TCM1]OAN56476.1 hypothetical protein A7Q26_02235 [Sphingobium sp. TCM1]
MPRITFVQADGAQKILDVPVGESLMRCAQNADVIGILAECGGACACATCQVVVPSEWRARLPAPELGEQSMLDEEEANGRRLSCQLIATDDMDGLVLHVPSSQY